MCKDDVKCPYCGADNEICHDDGYGLEENTKHQTECRKCEKMFVFYTEISLSYDVFKADCLNGGKHKYEETKTIPRCFRQLECKTCGNRKEIEGIEKERKEYIAAMSTAKPRVASGN